MARKCGSCDACCTVMSIPELDKPPSVACDLLRPYSDGGCCSVYEDKPASCNEFKCGWLRGAFSNKHRPDRSGMVMYGGKVLEKFPKLNVLVLAEARKGAADRPAGRQVIARAMKVNPNVLLRRFGEADGRLIRRDR